MTNSSTNNNSDEVEIIRILEGLLDRDEDITARAVARSHSHITHASSFTRSPSRANLLAQYQARQKELRQLLKRNKKRPQEIIAEDLAKKDRRIAELEKQVEVLTASHVAMIRIVGELGGMSKWQSFFESYGDIRETLQKLSAVPSHGKVTLLPTRN